MVINCKLTDSTKYNQFCCIENAVYTLKISKHFKYWYYDLCDLIDFIAAAKHKSFWTRKNPTSS